MNEEDLLAMSINHEIDMDILRQLGELGGVDHTKTINLLEKRFLNTVYRFRKGMTNKTIHGVDIHIPTDGVLTSFEGIPTLFSNKV
jgi:hypothetical protein